MRTLFRSWFSLFVWSQGYEFISWTPLRLRLWWPCNCSQFFTKQVTPTYPQDFILPFSRLSNSGDVYPRLYSTVLPSFELRWCGQERGHDINTIAAETLLGLVRVLPVPPEQLYAFSLVDSRVELCTCYLIYIQVFHPWTAGTVL